jgi:bacterioferritin (cytochrome b1)
MLFADLLAQLNDDLKNEWKHFKFYLYHASAVTGLHAHEYKEFLLEQAASEMKHITQFSDMLIGLGVTPTIVHNEFPKLQKPREILEYALEMEWQVVTNYAERIEQLPTIPRVALLAVDLKWIEIFLEKQIEDSRQDLDHLRQILAEV